MAGESLHIKGDIVASEDLQISGRIEGTVSVPDHVLIVGPTAQVEANVDARAILLAGTLIGSAVARERVELQAECVFEGSLEAQTMLVKEGAMLRAKVTMPERQAADGRSSLEPRPALTVA